MTGVCDKHRESVKEVLSDLEKDVFVLAGFDREQGIKIKNMIKATVCNLYEREMNRGVENNPGKWGIN